MIISGNYGHITLDSTLFCNINSWDIDIQQEHVDTTGIDTPFRSFAPSLISATGSFTSLEKNTKISIVGETTGTNKKYAGVFVTGGGNSITGDIRIESISPSVNTNSVVEWDYQFIFTGEITIA